jgi:DNA-binding MarR family transcriptional regulator
MGKNYSTHCKDIEDFPGGFMYSIHMLYVTLQKRLEHVLLQHGKLSFSQFLVLMPFTDPNCPPITQARLAECLLITEATVSRHVTSLLAKKFLVRKHTGENKKAYALSVTKEGNAAISEAKVLIQQELQQAFLLIDEKTQTKITNLFLQTVDEITKKTPSS